MTKRKDLLKRIKESARQSGIAFKKVRSGSNHDIWVLGTATIPIPRHSEIRERTAEDIFRECAGMLGEDWWRR